MELTLHIDLENRLSLLELQEFELRTSAIGKSASEVVAELIRENFLAAQKQKEAQPA